VGHDERRAGLQSLRQFFQCAQTLFRGKEMQGQQAGSAVEGPDGCGVDISFDQRSARGERTQRRLRQCQHFSGGIDAGEPPAGVRVGEHFQFQAATGAEDQHMTVLRHGLGQQQRGHLLHGVKTGHLPDGAGGVAGYGLGIGKRQGSSCNVRRWMLT
jgi:hypothetical protein